MRNVPVRHALFVLIMGAAGAVSPPAHGQRALAFLTSTTGNGNLGSWPEAQGKTGGDAADAICQARAEAAALADPESFVAWLSTDADDAWCRIRGLTGKRAENCAQGSASLPEAGPWHRIDGKPFLARIDDALDIGRVFSAADVNEWGQLIDDPLLMGTWTATYYTGELLVASCLDWTSDSSEEYVTVGWPNRTTADWTGDLRLHICSQSGRLLCMQARSAEPFRPREWGRPAFLTSSTGNGDLSTWSLADGASGIAAGDAVCQAEARAADLPLAGTFKAWLSDDDVAAGDRFQWDGAWARLDGMRVADDLSDLTDGRLATSLSVQSNGFYQFGIAPLTGTTPAGTTAASHCESWTTGSPTSFGMRGRSNAVQGHWTEHVFGGPTGAPCALPGRLYCLSDSDQLFADGSEWPLY